MGGFASEKPRSYIEVHDVKKGWELCVTDPLNTKREGKQRASISNRERGQHFYARTYGLLAMCLVFFVVFMVTFLIVLKRAILTWQCSPYWLGSIWHWLGSVPALLQAAYRMIHNIILFEKNPYREEGRGREGETTGKTVTSTSCPEW
jgi:hypothetical protein